jgi:D-arabinose 1-dehydrogenase-like Zn-dependent alcohol dehydrogenase
MTLGHENAGWIAEVGPGVAHLAEYLLAEVCCPTTV